MENETEESNNETARVFIKTQEELFASKETMLKLCQTKETQNVSKVIQMKQK